MQPAWPAQHSAVLKSSMRRLLAALLGTSMLQLVVATGRLPSHHIYQPGKLADSCAPADFHASYWTADGAPGAQPGVALPGTAYAQRVLYQHQHPASCSGLRFIAYSPCYHGIGSTIHIMGQMLSHALRLNRVLMIEENPEHPYYDSEYCPPGTSVHDCYFEPVSNCTWADVAAAQGLDTYGQHAAQQVKLPEDDGTQAPVIWLHCNTGEGRAIPAAFHGLLEASVIRPELYYYWWRAQSATYLVRPNERTLREMEARKAQVYPAMRVPAGALSVHVRRGDKWLETAATSDEKMSQAAEMLFFAGSEAHGLTRNVFLSTEDPGAVAYFEQLSLWNTTYANVPRKPNKNKTTQDYAKELGPANDMLNSLISLDLALQCDGWVGTLTSNWCRLIDELRSTMRCKADKLYVDAQQTNPPKEMDWRRRLLDASRWSGSLSRR